MSLLDKLKSLVTVPDEGYFEEETQDDSLPVYQNEEKPERRASRASRTSTRRAVEEEPPVRSAYTRPSASERSGYGGGSKVVDIHTTAKLQVVLRTPDKYEDAKEIADDLNEKRTVVLNLEKCNREAARRLIDFLGGVAYANGGQPKRIAQNTFIITPYNVDVMGDLLDEIENNGYFFG